MTNKAKLLKIYPNLFDPNLPLFIECPKNQEKNESKEAFKKICPYNVIITAVEGYDANCAPACVWRVFYQMKNEDYCPGDDSNRGDSNQPVLDLPEDQASLLDFFEKLTNKSHYLDLGVARKYKKTNCAVVEYFPKGCACNVQNFDRTAEEPRMWSIKETEINLEKLKICHA